MKLFLEETGYFLQNGNQRLLMNHVAANEALSESIRTVLEELAMKDDREIVSEERYLNKAFGAARYPCLRNFVVDGRTPYLAMGPNDMNTRIHKSNESIPLDTLRLSSEQFWAVLQYVRCRRYLRSF